MYNYITNKQVTPNYSCEDFYSHCFPMNLYGSFEISSQKWSVLSVPGVQEQLNWLLNLTNFLWKLHSGKLCQRHHDTRTSQRFLLAMWLLIKSKLLLSENVWETSKGFPNLLCAVAPFKSSNVGLSTLLLCKQHVPSGQGVEGFSLTASWVGMPSS